MEIVEIFDSIQGEGRFIGVPSTFVRFAGCNLHPPCIWCDTKYALAAEETERKGVSVSDMCTMHYLKHVVITGGEPLLQWTDVMSLCDYLSKNGHLITIETNGTIPYGRVFEHSVYLWSISPKFGSSGHQPDVDALRTYRDGVLPRGMQFKFVIQDIADLHMARFIIENSGLAGQNIVLQPQGGLTIDAYKDLLDLVRTEVDSYFWRLTHVQILPQLHVLLWQNARGV